MLRAGLCSLVLAFVISACSSGTAPQSLDVASCLKVTVEGPATVVEGKGLTAKLITSNTCDQRIQLPIASATLIDDGQDTGVELSFFLTVTDPQPLTENGSQGYLVRWMVGDENVTYDRGVKYVGLEPDSKLERSFSWGGYGKGGKLIPSGDYVLFGTYQYSPSGLDDWRATKDIQGLQPFKIVPQ